MTDSSNTDSELDALASVFYDLLNSIVEELDTQLALPPNRHLFERVYLRHLGIKRTALDIFSFPFDVTQGQIGKLEVSVDLFPPVVKVLASDINLVVRLSSPSVGKDEGRSHAAKLLRLRVSELLDLAFASLRAQTSKLSSTLRDFIRHLRIEITNVEVKFENSMNQEGSYDSIGLNLSSLRWLPCISPNDGRFSIDKSLQMEGVYFFASSQSTSLLTSSLPHRINDLLQITALCSLVFSGESTGEPSLNLLFDIPRLSISLTDLQFQCITNALENILMRARQIRFRRFKPPVDDVEMNLPKARLRFALDAVMAYEAGQLLALERGLSFTDIRLYRCLATLGYTSGRSNPSSLAGDFGGLSLDKHFAIPSLSGPNISVKVSVKAGSLVLSKQILSSQNDLDIMLDVSFDSLSVGLHRLNQPDAETTVEVGNLVALNRLAEPSVPLLQVKGRDLSVPQTESMFPFFFLRYYWTDGTLKLRILPTELVYDQEFVEELLRFMQVSKERLQPIEWFLTIASATIQAAEEA
ncbi:hypothetical protein ONZ45_g19628 [Pleurotus djamor]|nr:hypothetical protein ONZ45_g19628 [Pleurotus djamor]